MSCRREAGLDEDSQLLCSFDARASLTALTARGIEDPSEEKLPEASSPGRASPAGIGGCTSGFCFVLFLVGRCFCTFVYFL